MQGMNGERSILREIESGKRIVVGVNKFKIDEPRSIKLMKVDETVEARQLERLSKLKKERDNKAVQKTLKDLKEAALEGVNLVLPCMAAVKAYATIGEMCDVLREIWGEYKAPIT
jgi:methylmalonyl-CoA mutase N-terminal domain/subunit